MKKSDLIKLLESFAGDPEVIVELPDGETSVPIQQAATYDESSNPDTIHLVTVIR